MKNRWIRVIESHNRELLSRTAIIVTVCEQHFHPNEILHKGVEKILTSNAVPSVLPPPIKMENDNDVERICRSCSCQCDYLYTLDESIRVNSLSRTAAQMMIECADVKVCLKITDRRN